MMSKHNSINLQLVVGEKRSLKKAHERGNGHPRKLPDTNSRNFNTRLIPRYSVTPEMPADLPEPNLSASSERILKERYLLKGGNLEVMETIAQRLWHVAYDIASAGFDFGDGKKEIHQKAIKFYKLMATQQFEPNSPTLMNAGKQNGLQYSACFVLPIEDSLTGIFDSIKYAALIHQSGGGTGFAFSRLRPNGSTVKSTGGVASGPVSFLRVFDAATRSIKQGGTRRGANMGILRVDHPDILEFIRCKAELDENNRPIFEAISASLPDEESQDYLKTLLLDNQISNFNISVAITDKFMECLQSGKDYELLDPRSKEVVGKLSARDVFQEIVERAWKTGDPGLVFIDRINNSRANPVRELEEIEATNPCGEQPLAPWDACNLGSINLSKFVTSDHQVDWEGLLETVRLSVEFLDDVVQTNPFSLEPIYSKVHDNRRIGLGVMGWADMLFRMQIPYDSEEALNLGGQVMKFINEQGHLRSQELAQARGAFPNFPYSIYKDDKPIRNATITTIAPTGTISIIADCSSGIEPVFALAYLHRAKGVGNSVRTLTIANQTFEMIAKAEGFYSEDLASKVMEKGTVRELEGVPESWQKVFVTAPEIAPAWHVRMQAAFQKYVDNGTSKTINLPNSATVDDVKNAYLLAWESGCLGITVYRDGSKATQVLNVSSTLKERVSKAKEEPTALSSAQDTIGARPMVLRGRTYKINTPIGEAFVTINRDSSDLPFEIFVTIGKAGMHTAADAEALGRMISLALRISPDTNRKAIARKIVRQLRGIGGSSQIGFGKDRVMSLADAIAKALAEDLAIGEQSKEETAEPLPLNLTLSDGQAGRGMEIKVGLISQNADLCPECGQPTFIFEEGCKKCHSCGYSMC